MKKMGKENDEIRKGFQISAELVRKIDVVSSMRHIEIKEATREAFTDWIAKNVAIYPAIGPALEPMHPATQKRSMAVHTIRRKLGG